MLRGQGRHSLGTYWDFIPDNITHQSPWLTKKHPKIKQIAWLLPGCSVSVGSERCCHADWMSGYVIISSSDPGSIPGLGSVRFCSFLAVGEYIQYSEGVKMC